MIVFKKLLPYRFLTTTWGYIIESFEYFLKTEIKTNYLDAKYLPEGNFFDLSDANLLEVLYKYGDDFLALTGYTSTTEFYLRRVYTLNDRIAYRKLPLGFRKVLFMYGITGEVYPTLQFGSYLSAWEEYYTLPEFVPTWEAIDTGWLLDDGLLLDGFEYFNLVTNHIVIEFAFTYIESLSAFITENTMLGLLNDIHIQKRLPDVPHFEIRLDIFANVLNGIGSPLLTTYYSIDKSISSDQSTYYNTGALADYSTVELTLNGTGSQLYTISTDFEVIENDIVSGQQRFYIKQLIVWDTHVNSFNEVTLRDSGSNIIVKSAIPTINIPSKMLTSVRLNFNLN